MKHTDHEGSKAIHPLLLVIFGHPPQKQYRLKLPCPAEKRSIAL